MTRAAHVLMQTEGRDIGSAAAELEEKLKADPRTRGVKWSFVGQVAHVNLCSTAPVNSAMYGRLR